MPALVYLASLALGMFAPPVQAADAETDPREDLKTAIPHAIKLLEDEKHAEFLEQFLHPEDLRRVTAQGSLEQFAEAFGERKAEPLLKALREIAEDEPTLREGGLLAEFALEQEIQGKKSIRFRRDGKLWHLVN